MIKHFVALLCVILCATAYSQISQKTYVQVVNPKELQKEFPNNGMLEFKIANYGKIPYGTTIFGRIFYDSKSDFCDNFKLPSFVYIGDPDNINTPIILVDADPKKCKLTKQSYNAEIIGASVVLLGSPDETFLEKYNFDDGTGKIESAPSIIIKNSDSSKIKDYFLSNPTRNQEVFLQVKFENLWKDDVAHLDYFMKSDNELSYSFFKEFQSMFRQLGPQVNFEPHYKYYPSWEAFNGSEFPGCVNQGKYCALTNDELKITDGILVLNENLRQKCIWYKYKDNPDKYWNYMISFKASCVKPGSFTKECSDLVASDVGIDTSAVQACMDASIKSPTPEMNFLSHDTDRFDRLAVHSFPKLLINRIQYKGSLLNKFILNDVCLSLKSTPEVCKFKKWNFEKPSPGGFGAGWIVFIIFAITIITIVSIYCYRRVLARTLDSTIDDAIREQAYKKFGEYKSVGDVVAKKNESV